MSGPIVPTGAWQATVQVASTSVLTDLQASTLCSRLSASATPSVPGLAAVLFSYADTCPRARSILQCTYEKMSEQRVRDFAAWVETQQVKDDLFCTPLNVVSLSAATVRLTPQPPPSPAGPVQDVPRLQPSPPPPPPSPPPAPPRTPPSPPPPPSLPPSPFAPPNPPPAPPLQPAMTSAALESGCYSTCVAWSLAAQSKDYSQQTSSCAGFFGSVCPYDLERVEALLAVGMPPPPPDPIVLSEGYDQVPAVALLGTAATLQHAQDGLATTVVASTELVHPWMALDLGSQHRLVVASITLAPLAPPQPPSAPPPAPPSLPPPPDPSPPPPPPGSPDATNPTTPLPDCSTVPNTDNCIVNLVVRTNNGICEDETLCSYGSDVSDCGVRMHHWPPHGRGGRRGPQRLDSGRQLRLLGRTLGLIRPEEAENGVLQVWLEEGTGTNACAALRAATCFCARFATTTGRCASPRSRCTERHRLEEEEPEAPPHYNSTFPHEEFQTCASAGARRRGSQAALLWAHLPVDEDSCWDCMRDRPGNCGHYFLTPPSPSTETREKRRLQHREAVEEHLHKVCCRVHKETKEKECHARFCVDMVHQASHERMARTLRNLHETGKEDHQLPLSSLIATDVLAPKLHSKTECRDGTHDAASSVCIVESVIHHVLDKHKVSRRQLDDHLSSVGLDASTIVTRLLGAKQGPPSRGRPCRRGRKRRARACRPSPR